jgi:O-antigen/teichoic acid export membrane protein
MARAPVRGLLHLVTVTGSPRDRAHEPGRLRRNLSWQTIANLGAAGLGALYLIWLGRTLGAERFGLFALANGVAAFVFLITDLRLQEAQVRFLALFAGDPLKRSACVRLLFLCDGVVRTAGCLVLLALSHVIATWLARDASAAPIIAVAAVAAYAAKLGNSPAVGVLRAAQRFDLHATVLLATWAFKLLATVVALQFVEVDVFNVLAVGLVCDLAGNLVLLAAATRELAKMPRPERRPTFAALRSSAREIRHFLASAAGISASDSLVRELDTTVVAWFLSLSDVGIYRMAKNIVALLWRAVDPVYVVLMPEFASHLASGEEARAGALARRATRVVFLIAAAGYLLGLLTLPFVVPLLIGHSFDGTVRAALIMLLGVVIGAPFIWTHAFSVAAGKLHVQLVANIMGATLAASCFVALTPALGTAGAATGFAVALATPFVISAFFWRRSWLRRDTP